MPDPPEPLVHISCKGLRTIPAELKEAAKQKLYFGPYGPSWYQELSDLQMGAADALVDALQLDFSEDNVVHRTQECLRVIGMVPKLKSSEIREMIELSECNDITFLWFLLQVYYATPAQGKDTRDYSVNERIIMSTICHLDMITTLRGLDNILPMPKVKKCIPEGQRKGVHKTYKSPYLEPLPKPVLPFSKRLPRKPYPPISFHPYDEYSDPKYIVPNEKTRWFANTNHIAIERECKSILAKKYFQTQCTIKDRKEYDQILFEEFVSATHCYCGEGHRANRKPENNPILNKLECAETNEDYVRVYQNCVRQILVSELVILLLFSGNCVMTNIKICVNCDQCNKDYEKLKAIRCQVTNLKLSAKPSPKFDQIRSVVFDGKPPIVLLEKFNAIAMERNESIDVCVKDIWKFHLYFWSDPQKTESQWHPEEECLCFEPHADPNDEIVMDATLKRALNILTKDPLYVIPFLPSAYKHPLLQQWIRSRYGITYSRATREMVLKDDVKKWSSLQNRKAIDVRIPQAHEVCRRHKHLTYGQIDEVRACTKQLRDAYFERINTVLINDARRFWPTLSPYLLTKGPPRQLYYSYMPAKFDEMPLFRIWEPE